ncbi:hypothetical protein H0H93_005407 [Arthromyces matolae]|nr:hypothetical protein H0H93_005407 [Arthromyces matolae]
MTTSIDYIAAATNRHPHAAAISNNSLAAFGSSNVIALWDLSDNTDRGVFETLPGHSGLVTCVRFCSDTTFFSADDGGNLICWRDSGSQWDLSGRIQAHEKAISALSISGDLVVTGSSDGTVKTWKVEPGADGTDSFLCEQTIHLKGRYPLALALNNLPGSKVVILAISGTDSRIHIWARSDTQFVHASVLAGHEDWVKALDFQAPATPGRPLILASGSQDATIRLWNIETWSRPNSSTQNDQSDGLSDDLLDAFEASLGDVGEGEEGGRQISLKKHILTVKGDKGLSSQQYSITFDALLVGHEAGVNSVSWRPASPNNPVPTLLSTSTDSSVILWSPSNVSNSNRGDSASIWINRQRFGDIGGQRLGGFVGGAWAKHGDEALAWGWAGSWRRWKCSSSARDVREELWTEVGAISGHKGPVKGTAAWHELGRPQVHGYDMVDIAFVNPLRFVSIADEKVARIFEAPRNFVDLSEELAVAKFAESEHDRPLGANVPPLGLSNKAVENSQSANLLETRGRRPFEGELAATTLWPEVEKIFGHGYESMTLAVSPKKSFFATACKATTSEHAVIRVYDAIKYQLVGQPLAGHSLTVTRVAFSPDEKFVLSVSRDRSWRLFKAQEGVGFLPIASDKSHGRIIWDCAWAGEGDVFATASRDKTVCLSSLFKISISSKIQVKIWQQQQPDQWFACETIKTASPATAVAFAPGAEHHR